MCSRGYFNFLLSTHRHTQKPKEKWGGGGPVADIPINPCQSANRHVNLEGLAVKVGMGAERPV